MNLTIPTWWPWAAGALALLVVLLVVARLSFRLGVLVATSTRRRVTPAPGEPERQEVPELFRPEDDRRRQLLRQRHQERAGMMPWNFRRPGMSAEEREALLYKLETGQLDPAVEQIIREELGIPSKGETK